MKILLLTPYYNQYQNPTNCFLYNLHYFIKTIKQTNNLIISHPKLYHKIQNYDYVIIFSNTKINNIPYNLYITTHKKYLPTNSNYYLLQHNTWFTDLSSFYPKQLTNTIRIYLENEQIVDYISIIKSYIRKDIEFYIKKDSGYIVRKYDIYKQNIIMIDLSALSWEDMKELQNTFNVFITNKLQDNLACELYLSNTKIITDCITDWDPIIEDKIYINTDAPSIKCITELTNNIHENIITTRSITNINKHKQITSKDDFNTIIKSIGIPQTNSQSNVKTDILESCPVRGHETKRMMLQSRLLC